MSFSGPLKYPCEAAGCPEISNTFGRGFKTSCRNVLPCSSFCDVERDGGEVALPEKVTLDEFWSLTTLSLCSVELLLLFRNLFSELPFTEFLMRWGLFLPTWVGLIFCEANWVTVLSWHFDRALAYFSTSLHLSATPVVWPQNYSLLYLGSYYHKVLVISRTRDYVATTYFSKWMIGCFRSFDSVKPLVTKTRLHSN